jgi:aspartyl-tRNA(Asn)/glutamyl-tRNA(Gln) amidotransferase subunit C
MSLSKDDITHISNLAHLEVSESEKDSYLEQLQSIFGHIDTLNSLNLDNVEPTTHSIDVDTPLRDDVVVEQGDLLLEKNAPDWDGQGFRVPKIR